MWLWGLWAACAPVGCLDGTPGCVVPSPCPDVAFACAQGETFARPWTADDPDRPRGPDALGASGDILLGNDRITVVIEALDHPHYIAPTGGMILDVVNRGAADDGVRHLFQATGLLPGDAPRYETLEILEDGDIRAVQVTGVLDGHPDVRIATRYEVRPCEPGLRIRTEVVNLEPDPLSLFVADAFYWGGRESLAFTPGPDAGFQHPSFGLSDLGTALREIPWMVGGLHVAGAPVGVADCRDDALTGFQSQEISAVGRPVRVVPSRDYEIYERFLSVGQGPSVSSAADPLFGIRRQVYGEPWVTVRGRLTKPPNDPAAFGDVVRASVTFVSSDDGTVIPWTQVIPDPDGRFSVRLPPDRTYEADIEAYGQVVATHEAVVGNADTDLGDLAIPGVGALTLDVTRDGVGDWAHVVLYPSDPARSKTAGWMMGVFGACDPLLGNPYGASPGCNRVLVNGTETVALLPGNYDVYAAVGPYQTIARVTDVVVAEGTGQSVLLAIETLPGLQPAGTLTGDFHVHGRASFDSSIPDLDRVAAFLASGVDVIAATDHDVVEDYAAARDALGADARVQLRVGTEATGHVLWDFVPDATVPKVVGHWNAWPVPYDADAPYRGAPWDERAEPGLLFTRLEDAGWPADEGVLQLNHPWGGLQFGRDFAWPTAIGLDLTRPLTADEDTGQGLFTRTPAGARFANSGYHVQEVMNGTNNAAFQQYRAVWHYLLSQGVPRGGTANSDSHSLTDNVLGFPRNLVWVDTAVGPDFDAVAFDQAVREGRMIGTNGPILTVSTTDATGALRRPSLEPFTPGSGPLHVEVSAAPWVPVDEVRVLVNGAVAWSRTRLPAPPDPLAGPGVALQRLSVDLAWDALLPATGDAWIVVEAGHALEPNADLDCDGVPDTGDNNGDGRIDAWDVDGDVSDPEAPCLDAVGPLAEPELPTDRDAPGFAFAAVVPGGAPMAFTNPLLLDRDGDGFEGAP